jgi:quinolinate synthase
MQLTKREKEIIKHAMDFLSSTDSFTTFVEWVKENELIIVNDKELANEMEEVWSKIEAI